MPRRATRCITLAGIMVGALFSSAAAASPIGDTPSDQLRVVSVDTSTYPLVTATIALPLTTRNVDESNNLSVSSGDVPVRASATRVPGDAEAVVLMIDNANGTSADTLAAEQGGAAEFVLELGPSLPIVVGTSTSEVVSGLAVGAQPALSGVGQIRIGGVRNWAHALDQALRATDSMTRVAVVVVSAGADQVDPFPPGIPLRLSRASGRTSWIALSSNARPGGALAPIPSVVVTGDTLVSELDSVAADLAARYRVRFRAESPTVGTTVTLDADGVERTAEIPLRTGSTPTIAPAPAGASTNHTVPPYRSPVVAFVSAVGDFVDANWLALTAVLALFGLGALALSLTAGRRTRGARRRAVSRAPDRVVDIREDQPTSRRVSSRSE